MKKQESASRNIQDYRLLSFSEKKSQGRSWVLLTSEEVAKALELTSRQTERLMSRMLAQERIQQLRRGVYLAPGRLPPGKLWNPSPYEALWAYMSWLGATWQITGLAAFVRYGFSTQVPQRLAVYNNKLSGETEAGGASFTFIKIPETKLGTTTLFPIPGGLDITFSSRGRTIFDAIFEAKRFGTLPAAYTWLASTANDQGTINALKDCCRLYGNRQTIARVGFFLERLGIDASSIYDILAAAPSKTLVPLIPGSRQGPIDNRWRIIENRRVRDILQNMELPDEDDQ